MPWAEQNIFGPESTAIIPTPLSGLFPLRTILPTHAMFVSDSVII